MSEAEAALLAPVQRAARDAAADPDGLDRFVEAALLLWDVPLSAAGVAALAAAHAVAFGREEGET